MIIEGSSKSLSSALSIWNPESLAQFWRSGVISGLAVAIPPAILESITLPTDHRPMQTLISAHAHPFYDDLYRVWIFITSAVPNFPGRLGGSSMASSYDIAVGRSTAAGTLKRHTRADVNEGFYNIGWSGVSFSGHVMASICIEPRTHNIILPLKQLSKYTNDPREHAKFPSAHQLSAYSGTLTYLNPEAGAIVVEYYD